MDTIYLAASATPAMGFVAWVIIGGLAGWIGSKIMGTDEQMGIFANVLVGVVGGFLGGWLLSLVGLEGGGKFFSFLTCLLGAVVFLWIVKAVTGRK